MPEERKALGTTLDDLGIRDLLSSAIRPERSLLDAAKEVDGADKLEAEWIDVSRVRANPYQPRKHFSPVELEKLASSIKSQGVLQPVVVRRRKEGDYELVAGERRLRASQIAGLEKIPAVIKDISDQACLVLALIENIQREELNVIELAESLQSLVMRYQMTHQEAARLIGKSRASVSNLIRLLQLESNVKNLLIQGMLDMGHARCLLSAPKAMQVALAEQIVEEGLSVRSAEALVKKASEKALSDYGVEKVSSKKNNPYSQVLQQRATKVFGAFIDTEVSLKPKANGGGWLSVRYKSEEDLSSLLAQVEKIGKPDLQES